jgi:hypothetical protein
MRLGKYITYFVFEAILTFIFFIIQEQLTNKTGLNVLILALFLIDLILTFVFSFNLINDKTKGKILFSIIILFLSYVLAYFIFNVSLNYCIRTDSCGDMDIFKKSNDFLKVISVIFIIWKICTILLWILALAVFENKDKEIYEIDNTGLKELNKNKYSNIATKNLK